ncbi:hypothetical protein C8F04DRAFT_1234213, partial [Mycena alexandri]
MQMNFIHAQHQGDSTAVDAVDTRSLKAKRRQGVSDLRIPPFSAFALQDTSWRLKLWLERESDDSDGDYNSDEGLDFPHPPRSALEARAFAFRSRYLPDSSDDDESGHLSGSPSPTSSGPPTTPTTSNASQAHVLLCKSVKPLRITKRAPSSSATSPVALSPPVLHAPSVQQPPLMKDHTPDDDDEFYAAYASSFVTLAPRTPPSSVPTSTAPLFTTPPRARRESCVIPTSPTPTGPMPTTPVRLRRAPRLPTRPPPPPPTASASTSSSSPSFTPPSGSSLRASPGSTIRARSTSPHIALPSSSSSASAAHTYTHPGRFLPPSSYHHSRSTSASSSLLSSQSQSQLFPHLHSHSHPNPHPHSRSDSATSSSSFAQSASEHSPSPARARIPRPAPVAIPNFSRPTSLVFRATSPSAVGAPRREVPTLPLAVAVPTDLHASERAGSASGVTSGEWAGDGRASAAAARWAVGAADDGDDPFLEWRAHSGEHEHDGAGHEHIFATNVPDFEDSTRTRTGADAGVDRADGNDFADFAADYAAYAPLLRTPTPSPGVGVGVGVSSLGMRTRGHGS